MLEDRDTLRRIRRRGRTVAARAVASALLFAAMAVAGTAHALQSSTVVVAKGDTISALFLKAKVPQRELMRLRHSSPTAKRRLDRIRDGAILSLGKDDAGKLQRVQVTSRTGKQITFYKSVDPHTGSQNWQFADGAYVDGSPIPTPKPESAAGVSESVAKLAYIAPPKSNVKLSNKPLAAHVREAEQRMRMLRGPATSTAKRTVTENPEKVVQVAKSDPERHSRTGLSHSVTPTRMLGRAVREAESHLMAKRLIAQATRATPRPAGLSGMAKKIFEAEHRVHRTRARYELLAMGRNAIRSRATHGRVADGRIRKVLHRARQLIGSPYLWGGTTPKGFDCSGFVVYNLNKVGVSVPRTAHQQFNHTRNRPVSRKDLRPGDLVFFHDRKNRKRIGHVGIYIGNNSFIHAVKKDIPVKITSLDKAYYRKRFVRGGRVIS